AAIRHKLDHIDFEESSVGGSRPAFGRNGPRARRLLPDLRERFLTLATGVTLRHSEVQATKALIRRSLVCCIFGAEGVHPLKRNEWVSGAQTNGLVKSSTEVPSGFPGFGGAAMAGVHFDPCFAEQAPNTTLPPR